jgi:Tfp pilus assembly protein PilX
MSYVNSYRQKGATLFVGLMFLLVLTLVGLVAMQGTSLELKMATNQAQRMSAFQLSENMRTMAGEIVKQNTEEHGMQLFTGNAATWISGASSVGGQPGGGTTCSGSALPQQLELYQNESATTSNTWHTINGVFRGNVPTGTAADIAGDPNKIMTDCTTGTNGAGQGTDANESNLGGGAGKGGASRWFEIRSQGQIGNGAAVVTASEYRVFIE